MKPNRYKPVRRLTLEERVRGLLHWAVSPMSRRDTARQFLADPKTRDIAEDELRALGCWPISP